jgi:hypothetical protein
MSHPPDAAWQPSIVAQALLEAEEAARSGDFERAHQLSLKAAQTDPENLEAWLLCAETTPSIEEAVVCLNRANALSPLDLEAKQITYELVQKLFGQDPFILYVGETEDVYAVRSGEQISLVVPKYRSVPMIYPTRRPAQLQNAYRWLMAAFLGLPLAGIGAILFAPLAAAAAIGLYFKASSKTNRIYSLVIIILSGGLWLVGLLLAIILLVHLI